MLTRGNFSVVHYVMLRKQSLSRTAIKLLAQDYPGLLIVSWSILKPLSFEPANDREYCIRGGKEKHAEKILIRNVSGGVVCCTVGTLIRRPLYPLKDVESSSVVHAEGSTKLGLPPQKVLCPLTVKLVNMFNDSVEVTSAGVVHGSACSNSQ